MARSLQVRGLSGEEPIIGSRWPAGGGSVRRQISCHLGTKPRIWRGYDRGQRSELDREDPYTADRQGWRAIPRTASPSRPRSCIRQPCLICGRRPSDAHQLRFAQSRALGRKVSDEFTVPLCRGHHQVHRSGDEAIWWKKAANGDFACWPIPMPLQFVAALVQSEKRKSRR